jgi:hypothetical protein
LWTAGDGATVHKGRLADQRPTGWLARVSRGRANRLCAYGLFEGGVDAARVEEVLEDESAGAEDRA